MYLLWANHRAECPPSSLCQLFSSVVRKHEGSTRAMMCTCDVCLEREKIFG